MPFRLKNWPRLIGVQLDTTTHREKLISAAGGFVSILLVLMITQHFVPGVSGALIVASMGASAVLLFAVPHGPLSQPWPVFGGHVLSALMGVTFFNLIPDMVVAAAVAVGVSIVVMFYSRCIHPPGGATALAAVVGSDAVHQLGYQFVLTPVMLNALIILIVAVIFNYPLAWRRYPFALVQIRAENEKAVAASVKHKEQSAIPRSDLEFALRQLGTFSNISEEELERIYATAKQHGRQHMLKPDDIKLGHYYAHGMYSDHLAVRRIIDESRHENPDKDMVIYKIVAGRDLYKTAAVTRRDFARWAKYEVALYGNIWREPDDAEADEVKPK
jgi:CBS-domain-containing membrane protein